MDRNIVYVFARAMAWATVVVPWRLAIMFCQTIDENPATRVAVFPLPKVRVLGADVTSSLAGVDKSSFFLDLAIDDC